MSDTWTVKAGEWGNRIHSGYTHWLARRFCFWINPATQSTKMTAFLFSALDTTAERGFAGFRQCPGHHSRKRRCWVWRFRVKVFHPGTTDHVPLQCTGHHSGKRRCWTWRFRVKVFHPGTIDHVLRQYTGHHSGKRRCWVWRFSVKVFHPGCLPKWSSSHSPQCTVERRVVSLWVTVARPCAEMIGCLSYPLSHNGKRSCLVSRWCFVLYWSTELISFLCSRLKTPAGRRVSNWHDVCL